MRKWFIEWVQEGMRHASQLGEARMNRQATDQQNSIAATSVPNQRRNLFRRLYDWVVRWAESRYGTAALAAVAFAESSFFPIPPDPLQIALSVGRPRRSLWFAAVSTVCSVAGGIVGWLIGIWFWNTTSSFFFHYIPGFTVENFQFVQERYQQSAFLTILAAAFTPIPYKVFTIASGVFEVALTTLVVASVIGRGARFFLVGTLLYWFGPRVQRLLERYLELAALVLFVLLVGAFLLLKWLL